MISKNLNFESLREKRRSLGIYNLPKLFDCVVAVLLAMTTVRMYRDAIIFWPRTPSSNAPLFHAPSCISGETTFFLLRLKHCKVFLRNWSEEAVAVFSITACQAKRLLDIGQVRTALIMTPEIPRSRLILTPSLPCMRRIFIFDRMPLLQG